MDKKYCHKDIAFAIRVLNHPACQDDEEVKEWLKDTEHLQLLEKMRCIREGSLLSLDEKSPEVDAEWRKLNRRISRKTTVWIYRLTAAVCVGIMISVGWFKSRPVVMEPLPFVMVVPEDDLPAQKGVTLVLNDGEEIDLNKENETFLTRRLSRVIKPVSLDSLSGLVYSSRDIVPELMARHTLKIPRGGEYFVILDDGTKVWLNAETEFRYPVVFGDGERVVELSGEAYFQVSKDKKRPFIVKTGKLQTRVLGTEFNVQAYPGNKENVTLVNGQVAVKVDGQKNDVILNPGENALYSQGKLKVSEVDIQKYISWKEGYFYYDNERLEDILTELGRWYNFTVIYEVPALKELRFKFWVDRKETFRKVLEHLKEMKKLKIEDRDNCIVVCK